MKFYKELINIAIAVSAAACLWSCSKEGAATESNTDGRIEVSVVGRLQEYGAGDETKASLVNSVRVFWSESGDKVYVYDNKKCLGVLNAVSTDEEHYYARLTGSIASTQSEKLTLVYAPGFEDSEGRSLETGGKWRCSLASQTSPKTPFVVYATIDRADAVNDKIFNFRFATSVIRVNCTGLVPGAEITGTEITGLNTECVLAMNASGVPAVSGDTPGSISRTGDSGFAKADYKGTGTFSVATVATPASERMLTVSQGETSVSSDFTTGSALEYNQSYNTIVILKKAFIITAVSNNEEWGTITGGRMYYEGETATLTAVPEDGYKFSYWTTDGTESGKIEGAGAEYAFTVTADAEYTAVFVKKPDYIEGTFTVYTESVFHNTSRKICFSKANLTSVAPAFAAGQYAAGTALKGDDVFKKWKSDGSISGGWSLPTLEEMLSLVDKYYHDGTSSIKDALTPCRKNMYKFGVKVNTTANCLVLLPDSYKGKGYTIKSSYTLVEWATLEDDGAVCLTPGTYWCGFGANDIDKRYNSFIIYNNKIDLNYAYTYVSFYTRLLTSAS